MTVHDLLRHERASLVRRFRTVVRTVDVAERAVTLLAPANADDLISEEDFERDERLPYWADLWPSARILAEEIAGSRLHGLRALELGCGVGLVAIAATWAGAEVTATDYYHEALEFTAVNVAAATGRLIETRHVDWTALPPDLGRFDLVLASDVLYEPRYASLVARAVAATVRRGGEAIVADPGRLALDAFLEECRAHGLVSSRAVRPYADGPIRQTITLHRLHWSTETA